MIKILNSDAKIFTGDSIQSNVMTKYVTQRDKIRKILQVSYFLKTFFQLNNFLFLSIEKIIFIFQEAPGQISLTLDAWTSTTQVSFLGITAHWITTHWKIMNIIIDFVHLQGPHSGSNLADALYKVLKDYGILTKVGILY